MELFVRKHRGLELTDAGREYLDNCVAIFDSCENAASAAQRAHSSISGSVRVLASSEFGTAIIGAATHFLLRDNPDNDIDVKIIPNDKLIVGDFDFDCMIYVGESPNSALMRRTLGAISYDFMPAPTFWLGTERRKLAPQTVSIGRIRYRFPVRLAKAFTTAGEMTGVAGSPTPSGASSLGTICTSIAAGASDM